MFSVRFHTCVDTERIGSRPQPLQESTLDSRQEVERRWEGIRPVYHVTRCACRCTQVFKATKDPHSPCEEIAPTSLQLLIVVDRERNLDPNTKCGEADRRAQYGHIQAQLRLQLTSEYRCAHPTRNTRAHLPPDRASGARAQSIVGGLGRSPLRSTIGLESPRVLHRSGPPGQRFIGLGMTLHL